MAADRRGACGRRHRAARASSRSLRGIPAGRALEPGATLEELGLSSLERIEMMVALEEALNTTIDEAAFSNASTVADLERLAAAPRRSGDGRSRSISRHGIARCRSARFARISQPASCCR